MVSSRSSSARLASQLRLALVSLDAHAPGRCQHHGHGHVHAAHLHALDELRALTGREQRSRLGADDVHEVEQDRRRRAGDPVDGRLAVVLDMAVRGPDDRLDEGVGVDVADVHHGPGIVRRHQTAIDGEGAHARQHVAAGGTVVHESPVHRDLGEQIVHVRPRVVRGRDDGDLAGQGGGAAHAVDLTLVGGAHGGEQDPVAGRVVGRQLAGQEVRSSRGAATHHDAGDCGLSCHGQDILSQTSDARLPGPPITGGDAVNTSLSPSKETSRRVVVPSSRGSWANSMWCSTTLPWSSYSPK